MLADELVETAYSSPTGLARCCADDQPWVALRADDVDELRRTSGAAVVLLALPLRQTATGDEGAPLTPSADQGPRPAR